MRSGCIVECTLCFNITYGPWGGSRWGDLAKEAARELQLRLGCGQSDPLFQWLQAQHGKSSLDLGTDLSAEALVKAVEKKGEKVSLTRWFSWTAAAKEHLQHWWAKLAVLVFAGLNNGLFRHASDFAVFCNDAAREDEQGDEADAPADLAETRPTTGVDDPEVRRQQAKAKKGNIHKCTATMAQEDTFQTLGSDLMC